VDQAHAEKVFQHEDAWKLAPPIEQCAQAGTLALIEQCAQGWNARADRTMRARLERSR